MSEPSHYWLSTSAGYDVCQRRGCYWQRRYVGLMVEYRTARTDWRTMLDPDCPGREVAHGAL